jgi:hypothetical protein
MDSLTSTPPDETAALVRRIQAGDREAFVDLVLRCAGNTRINTGHGERGVDLAALFDDLKKAGPMSLIELADHSEIVRVWLE